MRVLAVVIVIALLSTAVITFMTVNNKNNSNDNNNNSSVSYNLTFNFNLLGGGEKDMSDYHGKIVLLDFMGATCGPCQLMMSVLRQLSIDYPEIEIVSIDVWIVLGETPQLLQDFVDYYDLDWTFGYDDTSGTLYYKYAYQTGVPLIYLLDKNGNIYYTKKGYLDDYTDYSLLKEKIEELI